MPDYGIPEPIHVGKVRDTYEVGDTLLMVASDRLSIFDVVLNESVPRKGEVLTAMTEFWLAKSTIRDIAPNHLVSARVDDFPAWAEGFNGRALLVHKANMLPIECIVRGYLVGSGWREYQTKGTLHGAKLPQGMLEGQKLPIPLFTPSTKAAPGTHDENISVEQAVELIGSEVFNEAQRISLAVYESAAQHAQQRGILLLDTKLELGYINGELAICDEILTPDSSRFVAAATHKAGQPPLSMDKEFVRQWAMKTGWNKTPPPPAVPDDVIAKTAEIYQDIRARITQEGK
jgi:phosphoribosylaminoimidazole-succinocarboxamide synthase